MSEVKKFTTKDSVSPSTPGPCGTGSASCSSSLDDVSLSDSGDCREIKHVEHLHILVNDWAPTVLTCCGGWLGCCWGSGVGSGWAALTSWGGSLTSRLCSLSQPAWYLLEHATIHYRQEQQQCGTAAGINNKGWLTNRWERQRKEPWQNVGRMSSRRRCWAAQRNG